MISQHLSLSIFLTISYLDPLLLLLTEFLLKYHLWLHDFSTPISLNFPHNFLLDPCCWCLSFFSPPSLAAWFFPKHPSLTNFLTYFTSIFIADFSTLSLIIFFTYFFAYFFIACWVAASQHPSLTNRMNKTYCTQVNLIDSLIDHLHCTMN